jgi:hypothetical protein
MGPATLSAQNCKAEATALLLADLGVTRSHNRLHTSTPSQSMTSRRASSPCMRIAVGR